MNEQSKVLVALTTSDKLYARFLRFLMRSKFHHALLFIYLYEFGGWVAIDIDRNGPHVISTRKAFAQITDYECYYCTKNLFTGIAACRDYMGSGYDRRGVTSGVVWATLKRLFGIKPKQTAQDPLKMYCLEYVGEVLKYSGVPRFQHLDISLLTTLDFQKQIEQDRTLCKIDMSRVELLNGCK